MFKINRSIVAKYWIPTEDEWYKAAYYDPTLNGGNGGYWNYATKSNTVPTPVMANSNGDGLAGGVGNFANFNRTSDWNSEDGNVTTVGTNGGQSYYGTFDQSGNCYEWNDAIINSHRGIRGGYWLNLLNNDEYRLSTTGRNSQVPSFFNSAIGFRVASTSNPLNISNMTNVGDINNLNDSTGYGSVLYSYQIGKYEVTNSEYAEFLNAVASVDTYSLYTSNMNSSRAGITRTINGYSSSSHIVSMIDFLPIGDTSNPINPSFPSNIASISNKGSVNYNYHMGKYEITNSQYCLFLNSIAKTDTNNLYNTDMQIVRSGVSGSYTYEPTSGNDNKPVCYVNMYDIFRFANWLHNGSPSGNQNSSTTENGAYDMSLPRPVRKANARFWIPNIDEWYKAAFYDQSLNNGAGGYYLYPTRSNTLTASLPPGNSSSANFDSIVGSTTDVGSYINAVSPYGCYDMAGNISERLDNLVSPGQLGSNTQHGYVHAVGNWNYSGATPTPGLSFISSSSTLSFLFQTIGGRNDRVGFRVAASFPTYSYAVNNNWHNKPIVFISWFRAARYCNWLHNGKPSGLQNSNTTEDGAYALNGIDSGIIEKNSENIFSINYNNTHFKVHKS